VSSSSNSRTTISRHRYVWSGLCHSSLRV
jgi:hypothetical protein